MFEPSTVSFFIAVWFWVKKRIHFEHKEFISLDKNQIFIKRYECHTKRKSDKQPSIIPCSAETQFAAFKIAHTNHLVKISNEHGSGTIKNAE